jgi:hypothetical protein
MVFKYVSLVVKIISQTILGRAFSYNMSHFPALVLMLQNFNIGPSETEKSQIAC